MNPTAIVLTENVLRSFRVSKLFTEDMGRINHIDFSTNGDTLIAGSGDESIVIYDCTNGSKTKTLNCEQYGVGLIHFTHPTNTAAIHSSTKLDDAIRHISLQNNKYVRYFSGHSQKVVTLSKSPKDDTFISGALDKTIRLWDLRCQSHQGLGLMHLRGNPVTAYDPEGVIFAIGINSEYLRLYDLRIQALFHRNYDQKTCENSNVATKNCL